MAKALVRKAGSGLGRRRTRPGGHLDGHDQETSSPAVSALDCREILETVPAAIYTTDAAGRITFYNDAAATLWGCRPELGERTFCGSWKLYWPDGAPMQYDECPMALALQQKRPVRGMEAIAERPDGTRVPFLPYPTPMYDASGDLIGAVNLLVDTSERRRTEERITASELRCREIFENVRVAVWEEDFSAVLD